MAAGSLADVANGLAALGGSGFSGLVINEQKFSIVSYWKGAAPARVRRYAASKPEGAEVRLVENRPYSRVDLGIAAEKLDRSAVGEEVGIELISLRSEGTGLDVGVSGDNPDAQKQKDLAAAAGLPPSAIAYEGHTGVVNKPGLLRKR